MISFELTNAPTVLMSLISDVCKSYLNSFVMVFINNTLIYSKSKEEHAELVDLLINFLNFFRDIYFLS